MHRLQDNCLSTTWSRLRLQSATYSLVLFCLIVQPVECLDDDRYTLAHNSARRPIGSFLEVLFLFSAYLIYLSHGMLGPSMGITSVLWLMMRNDSAISPKLSWM
jgi:hypothetical protein